MIGAMKNTILKSLLVTLLFSFVADAGLYKGLDDEGNITYSDKPFQDSEKFTPPPLSIVDAPRVKEKEEATEEKPAKFKYTSFNIIAPKNNDTIWNEPALTVKFQLKPELNIAENHTVWLLMDGKPLVKNSQSMSLQIGRADRGAHKLQGQVRNKEGKIVVRTRTIIVHIKNTVVPRAAN